MMGEFQNLLIPFIWDVALLSLVLMFISGMIYLGMGVLCFICSLFVGGQGNA